LGTFQKGRGYGVTDGQLEEILWRHTPSEEEYIRNLKRQFGLRDGEEISQSMDRLRWEQVNHYDISPIVEWKWSSNVFFRRHSRFNYVKPHSHKHIEMQYVYSGCFYQTINGEAVVLREGDVCILDPHTIHDNSMSGEDDIILVFAMNQEVFNNTFFESLEINHAVSSFLIRCLYEERKNNACMCFEAGNYPEIKRIFRQLAKELIEPGIGSGTMIDSYLLILFTSLLRIYGDTNHAMQKIDRDYESRAAVLKYIRNHYLCITLESAAEEFGFHPNYFSRFVKRVTGRNFKELVTEERLKQGAAMLLETKVSVEEISVRCGFTNVNAFYEKFKGKYGVTPKQFRSRIVEGGK